jgi:hypothetical protein
MSVAVGHYDFQAAVSIEIADFLFPRAASVR